jgi:hypothetical protein
MTIAAREPSANHQPVTTRHRPIVPAPEGFVPATIKFRSIKRKRALAIAGRRIFATHENFNQAAHTTGARQSNANKPQRDAC